MENNMNKKSILRVSLIIAIVAFIFVLPITVFAQDNLEEGVEEIGERIEVWGEKMEAWGEDLEQALDEGDVTPPPLPFGDNWDEDYEMSPKLNAYIEDMDFEDAYEKHYPYCYGVYISDVIRGGNADAAGIRGGDIIMEFDGEKVRFEDHLLQLRDSKNIGDTVIIKLFRNEKELDVEFTFAPPTPKKEKDYDTPEFEAMKKDHKPHPGFGGGGPELLLLESDLGAINDLLAANGFKEITDTYIPLFGGYGMGNVGNGWFLGGAGYGYEKKQKISVDNGERRYKYNVGFGGMTANKKHALTKNIVVDLGLLIGGGEASIEIRQRDREYSWDVSFDDEGNYSSIKYRKHFFVYRPSAGVLIRLLPWMGIHGSVGYNGTFAFDSEWKDDYFDFPVTGESPKPLDGLSYSLSVWFGH
jgi:hypothetical protein